MLILNITVLLVFVILWLISKKYKIDVINSLDNKQYRFKFLFPLGFYLMDKLKRNKKRRGDNLEEPLKAVYAGEDLELIKKLYVCNKVVIVTLILFIANFFSMISNLESVGNKLLIGEKYLQRPEYGQGTEPANLKVNVSDKGDTVLEEDIQVEVSEKRYGSKEILEQFRYAKDYIDKRILKDNESSDKVLTRLDFISHIPDNGMTVTWSSGKLDIIDSEGKIHNEKLKEGILVPVTAIITYYENTQEYTRYFKVLPKVYTKEELVRKSLTKAISTADEQSKTKDKMILPDSLGQKQISWAENKDNSGAMILIFGVIAAILLNIFMDRDLYGKVEQRNREMLLDYPEIINKFTLLVGAGMSLSNAWCKISRDYKEKGGKKRYAYEEMAITYGELMLGKSEITAYEQFGRRVKLIPYLRFSSLLAQNVKKGSYGLLHQLELEASEAFEERKELAKRMGEEAGTKLLFPMMLMLLLVLAVILIPAFISLQI